MSDRPMTDYERGRADGLREAAEAVVMTGNWQEAEKAIISLIPEGADQRGAQQVSNNPPNATADPQSAPHQNPGEQVVGETSSGKASERFEPSTEGSGASHPEKTSGPRVAAQPARPGPFVMVPREPTEAILSAINQQINACMMPVLIYRAMLRAAQEGK